MKSKENLLQLTGLILMVFEFFIFTLYYLEGVLGGKDYYQIFILLLSVFGLSFSLGSFKIWKDQNSTFKKDSWILIASIICAILLSIIFVLKMIFKTVNLGFMIGTIIVLILGSIFVLISLILKFKNLKKNCL